ncbi:MAG: F0F1 ATP synthase subunit epsilon [Clostridia bacterium]|nr:F0F1 ATP synthase subunit epsilon [Clostridia bacterium]
MKSFLLKISSPEGDLFCGESTMLRVRGTEGELAVMAGHIPFVTYVKPCECKIVLADGSERIGAISGGMLNVSRDRVILLTGAVSWK